MQSASPSPLLKLCMDHRTAEGGRTRKESLLDLAEKDAVCIETMHRRAAHFSGGRMPAYSSPRRALSERMVVTVESGVAVGSGEYLMDIYVGTPPRRFRMIMDTGSDLNWLQCAPCLDCFEQRGPVFDPAASSSYRNVTCPGGHSSKHTAPSALAAIGGASASASSSSSTVLRSMAAMAPIARSSWLHGRSRRRHQNTGAARDRAEEASEEYPSRAEGSQEDQNTCILINKVNKYVKCHLK